MSPDGQAEAGVRVVVVGAGFLLAADRVAQAGHEVVVLEARDRVGGRVWSRELVPGNPRSVVERGGEFVLEGYDVMRSVMAGLGLELADMTMSYYEREPRGAAPATYQEIARCAAVVAGAAASAPPGTSLAEVVSGWHGSPAALAAYMPAMRSSSRCRWPSCVTCRSRRASRRSAGTPGGGPGWRITPSCTSR